MQNILAIIVLLIIGLGLRRLAGYHGRNPGIAGWLFAVPESLADGLTSVVIYVSLPSLILLKIPSLTISSELLLPMILPWVMLVISVLMVLVVCRFFAWGGPIKGLLLLLVPLGNTSFLGIPMVEAFFGEEYVPYALIYDQFGTFLALATYGALIAALYGSRSPGPRREVQRSIRLGGQNRSRQWTVIILKVVAFPPFVALILALVTSRQSYPAPLRSILEVLSATLIPLVITAVGFKLVFRIKAEHRIPLVAGLALKLIIVPLIALVGCYLLGLQNPVARVCIFESAMPPQIAAWAVAMKAGLEPELGAAMVGLGILLSLGTLTALFQVL